MTVEGSFVGVGLARSGPHAGNEDHPQDILEKDSFGPLANDCVPHIREVHSKGPNRPFQADLTDKDLFGDVPWKYHVAYGASGHRQPGRCIETCLCHLVVHLWQAEAGHSHDCLSVLLDSHHCRGNRGDSFHHTSKLKDSRGERKLEGQKLFSSPY